MGNSAGGKSLRRVLARNSFNALLFFAMWSLILSPFTAASNDAQFAIKGVGLLTCEQFLERRNEPEVTYAVAGWLDGFVTAQNQLVSSTFDHTPWQSVDLMMRIMVSHCEKNGNDRVAGVANSMIRQFSQDRLLEASNLVPVRNDTQGLLIYSKVLERVQGRLAEERLYKQEIGIGFNDATRVALSTFQRANNLPVTGIPDTATLWLLFHPPRQEQ